MPRIVSGKFYVSRTVRLPSLPLAPHSCSIDRTNAYGQNSLFQKPCSPCRGRGEGDIMTQELHDWSAQFVPTAGREHLDPDALALARQDYERYTGTAARDDMKFLEQLGKPPL